MNKLPKQSKKPCATCPFTDKCEPGETGGSPVEVYVGQTFGPFWVPCHERVDYSDPDWKVNYDTPQCVGHAIMRAKVGSAKLMPEPLLRVAPYEGDHVFDDMAAFWAYHKQCSLEEARDVLTDEKIMELLLSEFRRAGVDYKDPQQVRNVNDE